MTIKKSSKLTVKQLKEMEELVETCGKYDGIKAVLQVDESFKAPEDVNAFLLFIDKKLISFITLFAPTKSEAELSAFTLPEYRKKGLFSQLHEVAITEVLSRGIKNFLYVCDRESAAGQSVVKHLGASYDFSEHSMAYTNNKHRSVKQPEVSIRKSVPEDSEQLIKLALLTSDNSIDDAKNYIRMIFEADNRTQHVALLEGVIAGMVSTAIEGSKSYIHGLCVLPEYRKRGIGGALLDFKVAESLKLHPDYQIELEVMTENTSALSIYKRAGFELRSCYDYFRKCIS